MFAVFRKINARDQTIDIILLNFYLFVRVENFHHDDRNLNYKASNISGECMLNRVCIRDKVYCIATLLIDVTYAYKIS